MTSPTREDLIRRSDPILDAANERLRHPKNTAKGDGWGSDDDLDTLKHAAGELVEIADILKEHNRMPERAFRILLMREIGDLVNDLRFLADKHGCLRDGEVIYSERGPRVQSGP